MSRTPRSHACAHSREMPASCATLVRALRDKRLTRTDLSILGILLGEHVTAPTRAQIAAEAGCAASSVPRSARKLEEFGYVRRVIDARDHGGRAKPTRYVSVGTYVSDQTRTEADTLEIVPTNPKRSPILDARIEPDTSRSPPMIYNSTPQELNPESPEASGNSAGRKILNGSAKGMLAHELSSKLIEVIGSPSLNPRSHKLARTALEVRAWIDDGADFDADVVPTVADLCSRKNGRQINSWGYFTDAVRDAATARMALEQRPSNPISSEGSHDKPTRRAGPTRPVNISTRLLMPDILDDPSDAERWSADPVK